MKLYLKYFSIQLRSAMEYKVSFILNVIGQGMTTFFSFLSMYFLFNRFGNIKGYSFNEVLLCFSTIFMAFSLAECFGRSFDSFTTILSNGEFDRIMVRPQNEILQVIGTRIEFSRIGKLLQAMIVFIYAIFSCGVAWDITKIITLSLMIIGGCSLFFGLFMIYAAICFFTTEGLEFMNIFTDGGREVAQYPIDIYKKWVLKFFTFIVPLAFVNYYPFIYIIGRIPKNNYFYMLCPSISIFFLIPCWLIWRVGITHYKSIGS